METICDVQRVSQQPVQRTWRQHLSSILVDTLPEEDWDPKENQPTDGFQCCYDA